VKRFQLTATLVRQAPSLAVRGVLMAISSLMLTTCAFMSGEGSANVEVRVEPNQVLATSLLATGATHMQYSLDPDGNPQALERGRKALAGATSYQNQHIMGFGADNPWPDPNQKDPKTWDWVSLDRRVKLMLDTKATPVITLCCAPTWMVDAGWRAGTDWTKLELAPLPDREDEFARLASEVAKRYPKVQYFQVWNQFKGMWKASENSWDAERYTRLYNKIWKAVKAVRPDAKIGGPYLVLEGSGATQRLGYPEDWYTADPITPRNRAVLEYWLEKKAGADFITIDRSVKTGGDPLNYSESAQLRLTSLFGDVVRQVRSLRGYKNEPIWMAEYYLAEIPFGLRSDQFQAVMIASILKHKLEAGLSLSFLWSPEAQPNASLPRAGDGQVLFSSTRTSDGGRVSKNEFVYEAFKQHFPPGTPLVRATSSSTSLEVLASKSAVLLINKRAGTTTVSVLGESLELAPYEVRVLDLK
jgi:Glycosyl hydrolases family 39